MMLALLLTACVQADPTPTPTLVPSSTPTQAAPATATPPPPTDEPEATEEVIVLPVTPLAGSADPPPIDIRLPAGWRVGYDTFAMFDVDTLRAVPLAVYRGPVPDGTGTIVLLWGFPSLMAMQLPAPGTPVPTPDLWVDGLRLFRLALVDAGCNPGTDVQRSYRIGDRQAVGTQFAIVDCPESPDTRGWFAGLEAGGLNYVFFVYTEPLEAIDSARAELQAILDSVVFHTG
jgi:hypothetical protein